MINEFLNLFRILSIHSKLESFQMDYKFDININLCIVLIEIVFLCDSVFKINKRLSHRNNTKTQTLVEQNMIG